MCFKTTAEGGNRRARAKIRRQKVPDCGSGVSKGASTNGGANIGDFEQVGV